MDHPNGFGYASLNPLSHIDPLGLASSVDGKCLACCLADVGVNFGLGFIPGYNFARGAAQLSGIDLQICQSLGGYGPGIDLDGFGVASGLSSGLWAGVLAAYRGEGGALGLARLRKLVNRTSFPKLRPGKQNAMLGQLGRLARLGRLASALGGVTNFLNAAAALSDAIECGEKCKRFCPTPPQN